MMTMMIHDDDDMMLNAVLHVHVECEGRRVLAHHSGSVMVGPTVAGCPS